MPSFTTQRIDPSRLGAPQTNHAMTVIFAFQSIPSNNWRMHHAKDVSASCFAASMLRANRRIVQLYDAALRSSGLTVSQFNMLAAISLLQPGSVTALAGALGMERSSASRSSALLAKNGWISMPQPGSRNRAGTIQLTKEGQTRFDDAYHSWRSAQEQLRSLVGTEEVSRLRSDLKRIADLPPE